VVGVLAAGVAELRELKPASGRLLVLRRRVVPVLARRTLQCNNFAHLSILTDFVDFFPQTCLLRIFNCFSSTCPAFGDPRASRVSRRPRRTT
jgi:hypothetical protein